MDSSGSKSTSIGPPSVGVAVRGVKSAACDSTVPSRLITGVDSVSGLGVALALPFPLLPLDFGSLILTRWTGVLGPADDDPASVEAIIGRFSFSLGVALGVGVAVCAGDGDEGTACLAKLSFSLMTCFGGCGGSCCGGGALYEREEDDEACDPLSLSLSIAALRSPTVAEVNRGLSARIIQGRGLDGNPQMTWKFTFSGEF